MNHLEQRISEKRWKLLDKERIHGAHAGHIFRIDVLDDENQKGSYIYKEFAHERNNEINVYERLSKPIKQFSKLVQVWDSYPQAILMCDLKLPLKDSFHLFSLTDKQNVILTILQRLADLHTVILDKSAYGIKAHHISSEWRTWCLDEMDKLRAQHKWVI